jgi:hypothetical protein
VAAVVVGVGLMWPSDDGEIARAGEAKAPLSSPSSSPLPAQATTSPAPSPDASPASGAVESPGVSADEELDAVAGDLLDRLEACGGDASCRGEILMDAASWRPSIEFAPAGRRQLRLLDDFGGVAVLRLDDADGELASQLIVIARQNGEWLLRDVHDVTQQP